MEKELWIMQIEIAMKDILKMVVVMEKGYKGLKMGMYMMEKWNRIIKMDMEYLDGQMVILLKGHLKMIKDMVKVLISTIMEINTKVIGNMDNIMVKENWNLMMGVYIKEVLIKENSMDKVNSLIWGNLKNKEYGKTDKLLNG